MTTFSKMKIAPKLGLGFGSVLTLMAILGVFSLMQLSKINGSTVDIATNWLPSIKTLGEIRFIMSTERRYELYHYMRANGKDQAGDEANMSKQKGLLAEAMKKYEPMINSPEERKLYNEFRGLWDKRLELEQKALQFSRENKTEGRDIALSTEREAFNAAADKLQEDVELNNKGAADSTKTAVEAFSTSDRKSTRLNSSHLGI